MRRFSIVLLSIVAIAFVVAAIEAGPEAEIREAPITWAQAALSDGEALYAEVCAVCHGVDAKGDGPAASALAKPAPDLTRLALSNGGEFPATDVQKTITGQNQVNAHGTVQMPMWGKVFEDVRLDRKAGQRWAFARLRILALTEYLESLQVATE